MDIKTADRLSKMIQKLRYMEDKPYSEEKISMLNYISETLKIEKEKQQDRGRAIKAGWKQNKRRKNE
jgi:hypothetical protein